MRRRRRRGRRPRPPEQREIEAARSRRGRRAPSPRASTATTPPDADAPTPVSPRRSRPALPRQAACTPSAPTAGWRSPTTSVSCARRILKVALAGRWSRFIVALFFYDQLFDLVLGPYHEAQAAAGRGRRPAARRQRRRRGPLLLQLKLCGVAAVVVHQPVLALPDLGLHPARACTRRSASGRGSSPPSPGRCSSSAWRSATTSCPRASRC